MTNTKEHQAAINERLDALYGSDSIFTPEEQAAMRRGYTTSERLAISGRVFGIGRYPQAISAEHARKLDILNGFAWNKVAATEHYR